MDAPVINIPQHSTGSLVFEVRNNKQTYTTFTNQLFTKITLKLSTHLPRAMLFILTT